MSALLRDHKVISASLDHLLINDRRFASSGLSIMDVTASLDSRFSLASLAETIVGQQLSVKAASTIWGRVAAALDVHDASAWGAIDDASLRALGVSFNKIKYLRGLAQAVQEGKLDFNQIMKMSDAEVIEILTSLKGFGVWSAQMILIFTLGRHDVWPSGDLGVQEGLRLYRKLDARPTMRETEEFGRKTFAGHGTAAALLLWRLKDKVQVKPPQKA